MKRIRIHNDIHVSWGITTNGKQESLETKTLQVQLVVYNKVIAIPDFSIKGNVISFEFSGSQQKYCGVYTLVCRDTTNGNLSTIDKTEAFELVPHSEEEQGTDNPNVALEVVAINTDRDSSTIGKAATIRVGKVYTLPAGSQGYVINVGTINDAVLEFGIPCGSDGNNGYDGMGVIASPSSVIFNVQKDGIIPSAQDKLIRMKLLVGGHVMNDAEIVSITTTNMVSDIPIESDGCSFYIRGSNISTVNTTDLNGKPIVIPCTQAEAYVVCRIPDSDVKYAVTVRAYTNVQSFYSTLVSNQREFKQTFTELRNTVSDQGTKLERYHSEFRQTAENISLSVSKVKQDVDGSLEDTNSRLDFTAYSITSTVEKNKTELNDKIEKAKSEIKQTTDSITAKVEEYKADTDGKIEAANSKIEQTADKITATVESNKEYTDGQIEKAKSEIKQTTDSITATVAKNKQDADGKVENLKSQLTQTANSLSSAIQSNKEYADGRIDDCNSRITQTSNSISSTVESLRKSVDGDVEHLQSLISQNASSLAVVGNRFNSDGTLKNTSGLLTTADKASLVSKEYVDGKVVSAAEISTMIMNGISTAKIDADNINITGKTMRFKTGEISIESNNFTLDENGNIKISGDLIARTVRLNVSNSNDVLSGSLLLGSSIYTMPELDNNEFVNLKLVAPLETRVGVTPRLYPTNSNVFFWCNGWTSAPISEVLVLDNGIFDIVGYGAPNGKTYWIISK
ncbi:hypothetical protein ACTQ53_09985 [Prevotella sp. Sow4_E9_plate]|uniref:hypothetical protein n=1 Tax=Prevotella sp. Sow4_E9_plate TaxID=3438802 RepID=UPI003F9658D6